MFRDGKGVKFADEAEDRVPVPPNPVLCCWGCPNPPPVLVPNPPLVLVGPKPVPVRRVIQFEPLDPMVAYLKSPDA